MSGGEGQDGSRGPALIDVLVPVYNARTTLESSVRSILEQTERDLRLVLIDDGSTDGSAEMMDAFAAADPRVKVHHQPNGGIVDALNAGLALCTAEFIARHDADDLAAPDRLARQLAYLRAHEDCVAVGSRADHIDAQGRLTGGIGDGADPARADPRRIPSREPYLIHPFLLVRRAALTAVGGYRHVFHSEDTDLYWRLQGVGRLHNMTDVLGRYRIHADSVSSRSVVNGRVAAISSQLAALSYLRRMAGEPDLTFPRERLAVWTRAQTLGAMCEVVSPELSSGEVAYLRLATGAKLMELAHYRAYEVEASDARFIRQALDAHGDLAEAENRRSVDRLVRSTAARLIRAGRVGAAAPLLTFRSLPAVLGRAVLQTALRVLPTAPQRWVRTLRRGATQRRAPATVRPQAS